MTGSRSHLAVLLDLRPTPPQWPVALRTVLCVVVPAVAGLLIGDLALGLTASLGGFGGLFGGGRPYVYRFRLLVYLALAQAAAVFLGILTGQNLWLAAAAVTVIAALSTLFCNAFGVPPAAYQIVLVGASGTAMAAHGADPVQTSLLVLAGGVFAGFVHVLPGLWDFRSPERRIVAAAAEDAADYLEAIGTADVDRARHTAAERLYEAWLMLVNQQPRLRHPGPELLRLRELARQIQLQLADAMRRDHPDRVSAARLRRLGRQAMLRRSLQMTYVPVSLPLGRPTRLATLQYALRPGSRSLLVLARVTVAAGAIGLLGAMFGLAHSYWGIAAAVLVLSPGFDRQRTIERGLQRTVGTILGVGLAAALLHLDPRSWVLIAVLAVLTFVTQLLVPRNYAAAAVFITASALMIANAGGMTREPADVLFLARAGETALGCGLALVVFAGVSRKSPTGWLPSALAGVLEAAAQAVDELTPATVVSPAGMMARRRLQSRTIALDDTFEHGMNGFAAQQLTTQRLWPAVAAAERLAYRVLAEGWRLQEWKNDQPPQLASGGPGPVEPPPSAGLRELASAIRSGRIVRPSGEVPSFLSRDVGDLVRVLGPLDTSRLPEGVLTSRRRDSAD
ncbi:MAG: FUSC family protein [Microlunatus sp.]